METFYTYLWLREDGSPYYVGKGKDDRGFTKGKHRFNPPAQKGRIIIQEWLSEESAYSAEKFLISYYGRIDLGTGCLRNLTDGGENPPSARGKKWTEEQKKRMIGNTLTLGLRMSKETREQMSNSHIERFTSSITGPLWRAERSKRGSLGLHIRWHVKRNINKEGCALCGHL